MAKKGQWVQIHSIVLNPSERAPQVPDDTKAVPLEMWVKGNLNADAELNSECEVTTVTGRIVKGTLVAIEPRYVHDYGDYVPELDKVREMIRKALGV